MEKAPLLLRIGFTQGVKASKDPSAVPVGAIWDALNVSADESGILRIRDGCVSLADPLGPGPVQGAIAAFGGVLFIWKQIVHMYKDGEITVIDDTTILGEDNGTPVEMVRWTRGGKEVVYILSGRGLYETDSTTLSLVDPYIPAEGEPANLLKAEDDTQDSASGPACAKLGILRASLSQRIAVAGFPASPNTVYLSAPLDATYWPVEQIIQLPDDGAKITGLANWYGALVIFRDRDIWAFFGTEVSSEASLVVQERAVGCVSPRTIASVPGIGMVFLGPDNVYALQGVSGVENQVKAAPIGHDIRPHLIKAMGYGLKGTCAIYHNDEYRLSIPEALSEAKVFRLRLQDNAGWYPDTGPRVAVYVPFGDKLLGAQWLNGQLMEFKSWLLDGTEQIPFYAAFARESFQHGPVAIRRLFIYVISKGRLRTEPLKFFGPVFNTTTFGSMPETTATYIQGTAQHLNVSVVVDGNVFTVKDFTVHSRMVAHPMLTRAEPVQVYEARFRPTLKGHFAQVRIEGMQPEEDIAILGYGIEYATSNNIRGKTNDVEVS